MQNQAKNKMKVLYLNTSFYVATPKTTIQTAVLTNNLEVIKQHIAAGTDLNVKDQMTGSTPYSNSNEALRSSL